MIHDTVILDSRVQLGTDVSIAPYTVVDGDVTIGDGCRIGPHCHISAHTQIGSGSRIHAGAVVGGEPQDFSYNGEVTYTRIGANCHIREYATIHRGAIEGSSTTIGDDVMIMAFAHVGHNCIIADGVVLVNGVELAGHVEIGRRTFISSGTKIHQFVRIGAIAMLDGDLHIRQDVAPYCMIVEDGVVGPNTVGLRRDGMSAEDRSAVKTAIRYLAFEGLTQAEALAQIDDDDVDSAAVSAFAEFIRSSKRGVMRSRRTK
jgi:UDP-N-acetylglucosamine acyltransferase